MRVALMYSSLLLLALVGVVQLTPTQKVSYVKSESLLFPPEHLKLFTLGYDENVADGLWLRVIQDFDRCEQSNRAPGLPALLQGEGEVQPSRCNKGWVFHMINVLTDLTPRFRTPFYYGATLLSVLVDDREGAKIIFDKALKNFPNDGEICFQAAYHYLFELKDEMRAAELLVRAGDLGGPPWVYALAAQLHSKNGQLEFAKKILKGASEKQLDGYGADQIEKRLRKIEEKLGQKPIGTPKLGK